MICELKLMEEWQPLIWDINRHRETSILLVELNSQPALSIADRGYVREMGKIPLRGKCKDLLKSEQVKKAYLGES